MKKIFRLYTDNRANYNSSIFDLIDGDKETKQTKGLAYVFSQYNDFLFAFFNYKPVSIAISHLLDAKIDKRNITAIEVSAERLIKDKKRGYC